MLRSKKILLLTTFFFATAFSIAQQTIKNDSTGDKYRAVHWGLKEGLSQGEVYHILKDVNGFLWVGTGGGLSRFDGSRFKNYYHDPKKSGTIDAGNTSGGLVEDSLHNIWIGTDKGLYRYDIKADTFSHFLPAAGMASSNTIMSPLLATRDKLFCKESDTVITTYDIHSFAKRTVAILMPADSLWYETQSSFFDAGSNSLWMPRNLYDNKDRRGSGLLQIFINTGEKKYYNWKCYKNIPGHDHSVEAMCYDLKRNCLWINSGEGLMQFTLDDKQFHYTGALNSFFNAKDYGRGVGISLDLQGRIWLATIPKGIVIYDPSDHSVELPFAKDMALQKEISDMNFCIYCDRDGITWSGFWLRKGIYQVIPFSPSVRHYKTDTSTSNSLQVGNIINFQNAGQGKLWVGAFKGLFNFDSRTGNIEAFSPINLPSGLTRTGYIPALIDTIHGKAYLLSFTFSAGSARFFLIDLTAKKCQPLIFRDSAEKEVKIIDFQGWSSFKDGLLINAILHNRQSIFRINTGSEIAHELLSFPVNTIEQDGMIAFDDGYMFLRRPGVSGNLTYTYLNNKWVRSHSSLDSIRWSHIVYNEKDQAYWVVVPAEKQLIHYNKDLRIVHVYTPAEGLPDIDILSLLPDTRGNIWFNTDRSVHQLNTETGVFSTLSEKDGLQPQNFSEGPSIGIGADGDLYLGGGIFGGGGFLRISPDKYSNTSSSVYLQSLEINQKPFPLSTGINDLKELSLQYFQNKITIETGIIDYYSKGSGHIRYKLESEGKNTDWQYSPAYYTIRYENLPPAKYRLVMQASNAANEFNGPEKILLINISPAFWNTWWFRIVAVLCIIAIIYVLLRWRLQERFRLRLERSEKETQLAEMRQKSAEMEMQALRAQMNPHFIFNSLNSINRFILQNDRAQASGYLTKFSKLVRMILQNSQQSLIGLESELESLEIYMNLEAVRFDHHFDYKISFPKDLDIEVLKVPPLFIQPYVENAIWHGLMHKEDKGQLDIDVSEKDDHIYIKITDNGIGRKRAAELASKSATKHKSMGLKITEHRIAMMESTNGSESPVKINDLINPDGTAAGTEVVIKMPVIYEQNV